MKIRLITLMLLMLALAPAAPAQTSRGTVTGIVTDPNGDAVLGATVELKNKDTNLSRTATTNDAGLYRFDAVDLGTYNLTITAPGFRPVTNTGILISANRVATFDAKLEVGTQAAVVDVSASAGELLQTSDAARGGNFTSLQVVNLPQSNLDPYNLGRLLPGVVTADPNAQFGNDAQFSVNGQRPRGNNFLIDGTENNDISVTGPASQINNEDAVAEVSVQTGSSAPSSG